MDPERMKFTSATVREVAERAKRITDGAFAMGVYGSHPEHGTSYSDAHKQYTWYGAKGARRACAYYSGAVLRWARLTEMELSAEDAAFLLAVQTAYTRNNATWADRIDFERWESWGAEQADEILNAG